ncbi:hypothetical protein ACLBOM_33435 [Escherichia coli]
MAPDDVERCKAFFDQGEWNLSGADHKLAYRLCWLGHWLIHSRHWFFRMMASSAFRKPLSLRLFISITGSRQRLSR